MCVENNIFELIPNFVKSHWDYDKNEVLPNEVSIFSENKFYWKNESGVSFYCKPTKVHSRRNGTSLPEQIILYYVRDIFEDTKSRYVFFNGKEKYEADIYVPSLNLVIEYDGAYYHKNSRKYNFDVQKNKFFKSNGLFCIRVRESGLEKLPKFYGVEIYKNNLDDVDIVNIVIKNIKKYIKKSKLKNYKNKISNFKLSKEDDIESKRKILKLLWLDSEDFDSCESLVNFYKIHKQKNDLYTKATIELFIKMC